MTYDKDGSVGCVVGCMIEYDNEQGWGRTEYIVRNAGRGYLILQRPTLNCSPISYPILVVVRSYPILLQPSSSYTGLSSHPTLCTPVLP